MSAKSSSGIIGTLIVVALFGFLKFNSWQRDERRKEIVRNAHETALAHSKSVSTSSPDTKAAEKEHMTSILVAGRRGDFAGMLALCTNIPAGVSASYRKGLESQSGLMKKFISFVDEISARTSSEGLDLDVMFEQRFLCGRDGFDKSLNRIDTAISFIDEMEAKLKRFRKVRDEAGTRTGAKKDPFNLTPQWDRAMVTMTSSFSVMRDVAKALKKLVRLHRDNPSKWKWEDNEPTYYDADLCESVNTVRDEISELSQKYMRLQNAMSEAQHETFDKLVNAMEKASNRK